MTAKRRRQITDLEVRAGVGLARWQGEGRAGLRAFMQAAKTKDPEALAHVRQVFARFRAGYMPGASVGQMEEALGAAFDQLEEGLSPGAYDLGLSLCTQITRLE